MKITVNKKLRDDVLSVEIEEKDDKEGISKALFFMQPDYCGLCKKKNILWMSNKANTADGLFTYIKRVCYDCKATSTAGTYKNGGLFWKNWEIYTKPEYNPNGTQKPASTAQAYQAKKNAQNAPVDEIDYGDYPENDLPPSPF